MQSFGISRLVLVEEEERPEKGDTPTVLTV